MAQSNKDEHRRADGPVAPEESSERVTVSSVPISRQSRVAIASLEVEAAWLDRLVVAACEMPVASGEAAVVEFLVRALGEIFPDCGVGAWFVPAPVSTSTPDLRPSEQRLFNYVP